MEENSIILSVSFEIKGKKKGRKTIIKAGAIKEGYAFDLEGIARAYAIGEQVTGMNSTRLDMVLDDYKKVFKATNEEVKSLMDKYWYKRKITMAMIVEEHKKYGDDIVAEDLLAQSMTSKILTHFDRMPSIIKKSLLYAIFKHYENESFEEIKADIDSTPQYLKDFIDSKLFKSD